MRKGSATPPATRKAHQTDHAASSPSATARAPEIGEGSRPSSPFPALSLRRSRFSSVPLVEIKHADAEEITFPASVELPRRHVTFYSEVDSDSSMSGGGLCSMSDTMESFKDISGSPPQPSVRIKHLTRNSDGSSRFPKLDECAHFHYDNVELGPITVALTEGSTSEPKGASSDGEWCVQVTSNGKSWQVRRSLDNFQMLDRQLHRCVYDRKFSLLEEITTQEPEDALRTMLTQYLERFSQLAGSLINCGPVLNWLELDNRGNRLIVTDEAAINTPAVAAAYVIKRYASQAADEISLEVGDIISVIDMPPPEESSWWRGKKGFQVGFFPCECVEIIGDKVPQSIKIPKTPSKPVLRKHGKLIAFFRSFLLSRPSRRKLKQSGILKERVFGCDLGEHLMNTGRDIPLVLKCCTEFIEQHGIVDGIYRLSGVTSNIQKLRLAFDEDRVPNLMDEAILQDIHCVASLLKMYFRELPNPLLTFHLYDKFVNAVQADEDIRLLKLRDVVQQLPPPHYRSLEYLMRHLSKVAAFGYQTGMTPKNVAIVWAPNLLRSRDVENGGVGALHVVGVQAVLTEYLIRYTDIIFSEKMPIFPTIIMGEETPKKTRPKSLAISTPTKLLSLEEARSRALTSNLPSEQQKFIDVGGGEETLPIKYHTVIDLPARRRSMGKNKKSPSGWRSFFARNWHTSSGRRKNRRPRSENERPKIGSPIFCEHSPLLNQDKAVTESDVSRTNAKKLRTVKSAESLFPFNCGMPPKPSNPAFSPVDEQPSSLQESIEYDMTVSEPSPSSPRIHSKHVRSTSHDSYFERIVEYPGDELENEDSVSEDTQVKRDPNPAYSLAEEKSESTNVDLNRLELTPTKKTVQKQKLVSFESDASNPKLQKLSLKRLYHTLGSPPLVKKKDAAKSAISEKQSLVQNDYMLADDDFFSKKCSVLPLNKSEGSVKNDLFLDTALYKPKNTSVPLPDSTTLRAQASSDGDVVMQDIVSAEIHEKSAERDLTCKDFHTDSVSNEDHFKAHDTPGDLMDFSSEVTLPNSSDLLISPDYNWDRDRNYHKNGSLCHPHTSHTSESISSDSINPAWNSSDSEGNEGVNSIKKPKMECDFANFVAQENFLCDLNKAAVNGAISDFSEQLISQTEQLQINQVDKLSPFNTVGTPDFLSPSVSADVDKDTPSPLDSSLVENLILSPPESFVDSKSPTAIVQKQNGNPDSGPVLDKTESVRTPNSRLLERSLTEVHEICPKFVSGIAVSGSFGHELFRANNDFSECFNKRRNCVDKVSPVSPVEESRRRFESEIGRLIVRDRQMKLEMEQIKAERQKFKQNSKQSTGTDKKSTAEKKFVDVLDLRKSPVKSLETERKKLDSDDLLKGSKDNTDDRKSETPSHTYSRYVRMENKPSVKELLSKFEGHRKQDSSEASFRNCNDIAGSSPKHSTSVFTNVQVINHNFPVTSSNASDSFQSSKNNQASHVKEHIFQTECVVRFPHPKTSSAMTQDCETSKHEAACSLSMQEVLEGSSRTKRNAGHSSKVSNSKTAFFSSDIQVKSSVQNSSTSFYHITESQRKLDPVADRSPSKLQGSGIEDKPFSTFKDTYSKANKLSCMKKEFFQSGLSKENKTLSPTETSPCSSRLPSEKRKRQVPVRQRPKSVPPPLCRLSLATETRSPQTLSGSHTQIIPSKTEASQNVPKMPSTDFNDKSSDTSQSRDPPQRIKDRAAMFERSLSFSGCVDKRTSSSSSRPQKAQSGSSAR